MQAVLETGAQFRFRARGMSMMPFIHDQDVVTVAPLLCFLEAGLRLKLATLGIVQYITPTMQFLLSVFVFHEHFDHERGVTFVLIWVALAIYTLDALRQHRMRPSAAEAE